MKYYPETYYLRKKDFPVDKAIFIIAKTIAKWCNGFEALLLAPKNRKINDFREGRLPIAQRNKGLFVEELLNWCIKNSLMPHYFRLYLYEYYPNIKGHEAKFEYIEGPDMWNLNINDEEYKKLKNVLKRNSLPTDLFYPETKQICIKHKLGLMGRFFDKLGFTGGFYSHYSPKNWGLRKRKL